MPDVWTGVKTDWLGRRHINKCRARMREFTKWENQLRFHFDRTLSPHTAKEASPHDACEASER